MVPFRESYFGPSNHPIVLNRVHCNGDEDNLTECDSVKLTGFCSHSDEVGVACLPNGKILSALFICLYLYVCTCTCTHVYFIILLFSLILSGMQSW